MNNDLFMSEASFPIDTPQKEAIAEREAKLIRMIGAIKKLVESNEWSSLKTEVFDSLVEQYRKGIFQEARKDHPDLQVLANLNGKYEVAKKYHDLAALGQAYQTELNNLRIKYGRSAKSSYES